MSSAGVSNRSSLSVTLSLAITGACVSLVVTGCGGQQSNEARIKAAYESSGIKQVPVYKVAGHITIDNQAPSAKKKRVVLVVMAYDASKPDQPAKQQPYTLAREDGSFDFGDGLPEGKYVMLFAQLENRKKGGIVGSDGLNNLFNDPDVNAKKPEFVIQCPPAHTDCAFNLNVAGETGAKPTPKSLLSIEK